MFVLQATLDAGRIGIAAQALGIAQVFFLVHFTYRSLISEMVASSESPCTK